MESLPELSDIAVVTDTVVEHSTATVVIDTAEAQLSEVLPEMKVTSKTLLTNLVVCPTCKITLQARSLAYRHKCKRKSEPTEEELEERRLAFEARVKLTFLRRTAGYVETARGEKQATLPGASSSTCPTDFLPSPSTEPASTPASTVLPDTHCLPLCAPQSLDTWAAP